MMHWEGNDILDGGKACLGEGSFEVRLDVKKKSCKETQREKNIPGRAKSTCKD